MLSLFCLRKCEQDSRAPWLKHLIFESLKSWNDNTPQTREFHSYQRSDSIMSFRSKCLDHLSLYMQLCFEKLVNLQNSNQKWWAVLVINQRTVAKAIRSHWKVVQQVHLVSAKDRIQTSRCGFGHQVLWKSDKTFTPWPGDWSLPDVHHVSFPKRSKTEEESSFQGGEVGSCDRLMRSISTGFFIATIPTGLEYDHCNHSIWWSVFFVVILRTHGVLKSSFIVPKCSLFQ